MKGLQTMDLWDGASFFLETKSSWGRQVYTIKFGIHGQGRAENPLLPG